MASTHSADAIVRKQYCSALWKRQAYTSKKAGIEGSRCPLLAGDGARIKVMLDFSSPLGEAEKEQELKLRQQKGEVIRS